MKRTAFKRRQSEKASAYQQELAAMRPLVTARANGLCEICRCRKGTVVHHISRRSQGGSNDLGNLMLLCADHHAGVHANPTESYERGWLKRSMSCK